MKIKLYYIIFCLFAFLSCSKANNENTSNTSDNTETNSNKSEAIKTEVKLENSKWVLYRDGKPYFIKGAAGGGGYIMWSSLKEFGGNSMRTYSIDNNTSDALSLAKSNGISIMLGISLSKENGFDYKDSEKCNKLLTTIKNNVLKFKDHPSVLAWAIGNEVITSSSSKEMFQFMNNVSKMIHKVDPNHPTLIVTAGITVNLANLIAEYIPDLDMVGINYYAAISLIYSIITQSKLNKPYIITEWGVSGYWEVGKTNWGMPIEPSSRQKAEQFKNRYESHIAAHTNLCLGSYAFLWGQKVEGSPTWFGLSFYGDFLEQIDELSKEWTGNYPSNQSPSILKSTMNGIVDKSNTILTKTINTFTMSIEDANNDKLSTEYILRPDDSNITLTSDNNHTLSYLSGIISDETSTSCKLTFNEKYNGKTFRLFVFVRDGNNRVATECYPFMVQLENN
jgi:hypothetical protein